jgi:hypothetical protein
MEKTEPLCDVGRGLNSGFGRKKPGSIGGSERKLYDGERLDDQDGTPAEAGDVCIGVHICGKRASNKVRTSVEDSRRKFDVELRRIA